MPTTRCSISTRPASLYDEYINDPTRSDGKAVGEPVSFVYDCNTEAENLDTAQLYQQEWNDIGFEVELRTTEQASYITKVVGTTSEPLFQGDFQIGCWADGSDDDPLSIFRTRYGDQQVLNWTNFTSPEIDAQIEILRGTDHEARRAAAAEISRITAEQMTVNWWSSGSNLVLTVPEMRGLETYTFPDGEAGERRGAGRVWWHEVWLEGATPASDVPTDFVETPEAPATTTTVVAEEPEGAARPRRCAGGNAAGTRPALTLGDTSGPLVEVCPGITTLEGIDPISATTQNYVGDATVGPFAAVTVYELNEGDADIIVGRYDQALVDCTDFATTLSGGVDVNLGYEERDLGSFGENSASYGAVGDTGGFALDIDVILVRSGNNLALVTSLHVLDPAAGSVSKPLAEGAVAALAVLG